MSTNVHDDDDICPPVARWADSMLEDRSLDTCARAIGLTLAWLARHDGGPVSLSHRDLMNCTGIRAHRTLRLAIARLETAGLLHVVHTAGIGTSYSLRTEVAHV
jgi:hypothetical protein